MSLGFVCAVFALGSEGLMGGGGPPAPVRCITDAELSAARQIVAHHQRSANVSAAALPEKFTFYPMGGTLYRDLFVNNFVDLDLAAGLLDFDCTDFTYNGHDATDTDLRTFGEQAIGVPVFAALNGTVLATHDGEEDMHTSCSGTANSVIIDHGAGRICYYWHLRKFSVMVIPGQIVKAGQQVGFTASSGCSTAPHLHFATYDSGARVEPFAGPCRPGPSEWIAQTPIERGLYARDLNITAADIATYPGLPFDMPRDGMFTLGVKPVRFWTNLHNQPAGSTWRVRFKRPNGSTALDSSTHAFGNPFYRWAWWWWNYSLNLNQVGTWHMWLDINGTTLVDAPFDVVATPEEIVNRAPYPITVAIEPKMPREHSVLICRVQTDLVLDDPDYDIVQYRYVWKLDGLTVRDVTTAAQSDAFPRDTAVTGSIVECSVTPGDGTATATTVSDVVRIGRAPMAPTGKP
jgi:hypothetical protein